jgi:hypothetical protein
MLESLARLFLGIVLHDISVLVLMFMIIGDMVRPHGDVGGTSWPGIDDSAGAVLEGAPDALTRQRQSSRPGGLPSLRPVHR